MWTFLKTLWRTPALSRPVAACVNLYESVLHRDVEGAAIALAHGADPNRKLAIDEVGQILLEPAGTSTVLRSPLHVALDHGDGPCLRLLLAHGACVEADDVHLAVRRLSERQDGQIGPRGMLLLGMARERTLDFTQLATRSEPRLTLADMIQRKQPALAQALGLTGGPPADDPLTDAGGEPQQGTRGKGRSIEVPAVRVAR